jgi:hypothetical protein
MTQDYLQWLIKALRDELTYQDNHKVLQYQCIADEGAIQICSWYLTSPFPCDQTRLTEAGPELQL